MAPGGQLKFDNGPEITNGGILYIKDSNLRLTKGSLLGDAQSSYPGNLIISNGTISFGNTADPSFGVSLWIGYKDTVTGSSFDQDLTNAAALKMSGFGTNDYLLMSATSTEDGQPTNVNIGAKGALNLTQSTGDSDGFILGLGTINSYGLVYRSGGSTQDLRMKVVNNTGGEIRVVSGNRLDIVGDFGDATANFNSSLQLGGTINLYGTATLNAGTTALSAFERGASLNSGTLHFAFDRVCTPTLKGLWAINGGTVTFDYSGGVNFGQVFVTDELDIYAGYFQMNATVGGGLNACDSFKCDVTGSKVVFETDNLAVIDMLGSGTPVHGQDIWDIFRARLGTVTSNSAPAGFEWNGAGNAWTWQTDNANGFEVAA
jgi:hypothetical protein